MKSFILFVCLFLSSFSLLCQNRSHHIRAEYGYAGNNTISAAGYSLSIEYSKSIHNRIRIASGLEFMNFERNTPFMKRRATSQSLLLSAYYLPLKFGLFSVEIGAGPYLRNWNWHFETGPGTYYYTDLVRLNPSTSEKVQMINVGYMISAGIHFQITQRLGLSMRTDFQNDDYANSLMTAKIGITARL